MSLHTMKNTFASAFFLRPGTALALMLLAGVATAQAQGRYTVTANGQEVSDAQTGLTWRRCAEGMAFNGSTCTGRVSGFKHEEALAHARDQAGWRLPNVKELQTLLDVSRTIPSIDVSAFPGTPASDFWTSTPFAANPSLAWYVNFSSGSVSNYGRGNDDAVRLVRASQ